MASSPPVVGRPADRKNLIVQHLRQQIVSGDLSPGSQLPTRNEIATLFQASPVTVQAAVEQLRRDGFLEAGGRQGTFVAQSPPHLSNYALVFPTYPGRDGQWTAFLEALDREAPSCFRREGLAVKSYYDVNKFENSQTFRALQRDVRDHCLAGIIFATEPYLVGETAVVTQPGIPRVAIMSGEAQYNCARVAPDTDSFWVRAMAHMARRGRRRVAVLLRPSMRGVMRLSPEEYAEQAGVSTRAEWTQPLLLEAPEFTSNTVQLLLSLPRDSRPDGLIVSDDNFEWHAVRGLVNSGPRVPEDLEVVVHSNFPAESPTILPVQRLGFDVRQVLAACIESLKQGTSAATDIKTIGAVFENETGSPKGVLTPQ